MRRTTGTYISTSVAGETVEAFVPQPLPPQPSLDLNPADRELLEEANRNLGRLDGAIPALNIPLFTYMYVRKEAVLSSQIEGTKSSLSDLLLHECEQAPGVPLDDVREVVNYVAAMDHGLQRIRGGFPLSNRLIREIHQVLMAHGRGSTKEPGEFRRSQNWIGGTRPGNARFVPPPVDRVAGCMSDLEKFLHDIPERTSPLIKAALSHLQFETIHPFLDGNGRIGRLMITLILCQETALSEPILYLSLFFKQNRDAYYEHLDRVRREGDWEAWLRFFLRGVNETSVQAIRAAGAIRSVFETDHEIITSLGRRAGSTLRVFRSLQNRPILTIAGAAGASGMTFPTAAAALDRLCELGITAEVTGRRRNRIYVYRKYLNLLDEGTEPI